MAAEEIVTGARTTGTDPKQRSDLATRLKKPGTAPPNLRGAARPTSSCGTCRYWKAGIGGKGKCRLYEGYPTRSTQVCDSFKAG
jgi:hypothetical protein